MDINFPNLQAIYNKHIDLLLSSTGLTTLCQFNYGVTNLELCPNCIYDVNLKKSAGKYKNGGPVPFALGKICPYCNGSGSYGIVKSDTGYLGVIWDYKKWINPPPLIDNPEGYIQTICGKEYLSRIRQCKDLVIFYHKNNANPIFQLHGEPTPAGLGDNNYLFTMWKKIGVSNVNKPQVTSSRTPTPTPTSTPSL